MSITDSCHENTFLYICAEILYRKYIRVLLKIKFTTTFLYLVEILLALKKKPEEYNIISEKLYCRGRKYIVDWGMPTKPKII